MVSSEEGQEERSFALLDEVGATVEAGEVALAPEGLARLENGDAGSSLEQEPVSSA
jgi:hypothetical protein